MLTIFFIFAIINPVPMASFTHLREYTPEERANFDTLLGQSITSLPFTLSNPIAKYTGYLPRGDYGRAMNHALDFFEISVQYCSCLLLSIIRSQAAARPNEVLISIAGKIDSKRPLSFGDWVNDIFIPLVKEAVTLLPGNELAISLSEHILQNKAAVLSGGKNEAGIVQIRNEYRGHTTTLSENIYKGVVYTLEPRLYKMLEAFAPLRKWTFTACRSSNSGGGADLLRFNGPEVTECGAVSGGVPMEPFHYYVKPGPLDDPGAQTLDLFPLVFCNDRGHVYVFHTLKGESISYISSHEEAVTHTEEKWVEDFDRFMQHFLPSFDISKELNGNEIRILAKKTSDTFIGHAYREKKYNRELFVDRTKLSELFGEFKRSDKTLFPLLGEAGQGKTNQLCYWTENLLEGNSTVLIFSSSTFTEVAFEEKLKSVFGYSARRPVGKLLDNIHRRAQENGQYVYFFLDAINECISYKGSDGQPAPLALYNDLCRLTVSDDYPRFKVLFTCRSYTWKNLIQPRVADQARFIFTAGDGEQTSVQGFTDQELESAYGIYCELFQMTTPFAAIGRSCRIRLKDPLALKISCTNFLGRELPSSQLSYTSIALFEKMFADISRSYAGRRQCSIITGLASYILEQYESGTAADSIPVRVLKDSYGKEESPWSELAGLIYKKDGVSVAYWELLNKPERPILRLGEDGQGQIQFIYERFLEYMLARVFSERERARLQGGAPVPAHVFLNALKRSATNVVFMGAMRNALIMEILRTGHNTVITDLVQYHGDDYDVMLLVNDTVNVLVRENYEDIVFSLIDDLTRGSLPEGSGIISLYNQVNGKIASNQADDTVIGQYNRLRRELEPVIRLRKLASISTVNGIFLTDYYNEGLYRRDPFSLLWRLIADPLDEVSNDTCMYIYYLSNKKYTLEHSPLRGDITGEIVGRMLERIKSTSVVRLIVSPTVRSRSLVLMETGFRIATLLIIDAAMSGRENGGERISSLLGEIRDVLRHFTLNFSLLRIMMPLFSIILRKQIMFQSDYVNNMVEYQTFWDDDVVPNEAGQDRWSRQAMKEVLPFVFHYGRYYKEGVPAGQDVPDFSRHHAKILSAYAVGDSFSYFALERLLVIMGTCSWKEVRPIIIRFFSEEFRGTQWYDYSQMSMLYIMFQIAVHSPEPNRELIDIYSRESREWTVRCRGRFRGRNSHKANASQYYKRNVMNWYCVVYCRHTGDNIPHAGDDRCVPVFYELLDRAVDTSDKELLYHMIDNISELISDYGYIRTALELLGHILVKFDSEEKIGSLDRIELQRGDIYQQDLITLIGRVLSTAKNYFPAEVDNFMRKEMAGMEFPGAARYQDQILMYNPSGEQLSDLFTHKFGNFLMWSLLNEEAVDRFAFEAMGMAADSADCFKWLDKMFRLLFMSLFNVRL